MSRRRKNPHPKRAVNARTVLKVREKEEPNLVLCSRIPDEEEDDLEANHQQIQKEETTFNKKGAKRKRAQHECDVCGKVFDRRSLWIGTCVRTRTRNRTNVMCARNVLLNLVVWKRTCVFTRRRNRTNAMCAMKLFVNLVICKATCVFTRREKPYECDVCEMKFRQSGTLKKHMRCCH